MISLLNKIYSFRQENDKPNVIALREIGADKIHIDILDNIE